MRLCLTVAAALTLLAASAPPPAKAAALLAAAPPEAEDHGPAHAPEKGGADHPKDHSASPFVGSLDLTIWSLVVFLLLSAILYAVAWKPLREGLDKREHDIAHDKEEATAAREEAARMRQRLEADKAKADEEVRRMLDKARADAEALAAERDARGKAEIQAERDRLVRDLQTARDQGMRDVWTQAATLSTQVAAKVIGRQLNGDDHRRLIDEALAELRASAEERKRESLGANV